MKKREEKKLGKGGMGRKKGENGRKEGKKLGSDISLYIIKFTSFSPN